MARLYANENFPRPVVEHLRSRGHDVLTSLEAGNAGRAISDADVLTYAIQQRRAVITLNRRDFVRLHEQRPDHQGILRSVNPKFACLAGSVSRVFDE